MLHPASPSWDVNIAVPSPHCLRLFATNSKKEEGKNEGVNINANNTRNNGSDNRNKEKDEKEEKQPSKTKTQILMAKIKDAGIAGIISYGLWEVAFWSASIPLVLYSYQQVTGNWPDLSNTEEVAKLSAQAFVYVNFSRLAVPMRIGLALTTTPYVQRHIVDRFIHSKKKKKKKKR